MGKEQSVKAELIQKRDELRRRLDAIKQDYARGLDADAEEQALQLQNAEVLDEIARITAEELEKVERRLAQIDGLD